MQFTVTIDCSNAAFQDHSAGEVAHILHRLADLVDVGSRSGTLRDSNGNTVGSFAFSQPDEAS